MSRDLYNIAQEVTDEVMGAGTYASLNKDNPDPGVQRAINQGGTDMPEIANPNEYNDEDYLRASNATVEAVGALYESGASASNIEADIENAIENVGGKATVVITFEAT